ncbi:MAG: c-type cytochrome [Burkholderiales bacterium]|nr:c-type cytochrome [Burkholderiales bacterium]
MTAGTAAGSRRAVRRAAVLALLALAALVAAATAWVLWRNFAGEPALERAAEPASPGAGPGAAATPPPADAATLARGEYLARAGNCLGCHTRRGGAPGAGGRPIATPFGTVYSANLTPDRDTGLGRWSASEFRRALQHGRSRDGHLLAPAFPYPNFTRVTRADADALYAWLMSRPAVRQQNRPHELRFPYRLQAALAVWRALFFRAEPFVPDPARSEAWNRGSYLVNGLAHCMACHASRNFLGAPAEATEPGGNIVSTQQWYAPSLADAHEAGVGDWPLEDVVALLKTGTSPRGTVMGPMAEVVARSTQHLAEADLRAMAEYLRTLQGPSAAPAAASAASTAAERPPRPPPVLAMLARGRRIYGDHCVDCHGERGEGTPGTAALAGSRAVLLATPRNVIQAIRHGGFAPTTAGNPRPFGMPPFGLVLGDDDIAAVASYVRTSWGNDAPVVEAIDVWRAK